MLGKKYCPICGRELESYPDVCKYCGRILKKKKIPLKKENEKESRKSLNL
ncbi:hypothetical protein ES703_109976 [subsurface metagenome]